MEVRQFDFDPLSGISERFFYDHGTDEFTLTREQEVSPLLDLNLRKFNDTPGRFGNDMLHHVASIPLTLLPDLEKQGIMTAAGRILDDKKLRAWLNDRDNRAFRVRMGRV
jgi:hypothetical protein